MRKIWTRLTGPIREVLHRARYTEPAALKARWSMALSLAGALGVIVPGFVNTWVATAIAAWVIVAPYLQGQVTRKDVWSTRTVDDLTALVALFPHAADEIKRKVGAGLEYRIVREHLEAQLRHNPA